MESCENVDLLWNNHNSHLCSSVNNWRHCDDFADMTLVYENEKVKAHKVVLATFSSFFRRILLENPHPHPLVYLKGVTKTEMDGVLDFMYKGKVEVAVKDIDPLMKIFSEFEVVDCDKIENVPSGVGGQTKNSGQTENSGQTKSKQVHLPAEDSTSELSISMESDHSGKDLDKAKQDALIQESLADRKTKSPPNVGSVMDTKGSNKRGNMEDIGFATNKQVKIEIMKIEILLPSSCHPAHIFNNIPYSLAYRLVRICSSKENLEKRFQQLRETLLSRGYRPKVVDAAIARARLLDRDEALKKVEKQKKNDRVRFITTFDSRLPDIGKILRENHKVMLESDSRLKGAFPKPPMLCFRRPPNIKDMVCRAKLPPKRTSMRVKKPGQRRCNKPSCRMCPYTGLQPGEIRESIKIGHSGEEIKIRYPIDCQTSNVIYELHCKKDSLPYIGETSKTAETRFVGHLNTILQEYHENTSDYLDTATQTSK